MTHIHTPLITENLDNERYVRLTAPFIFESDVLAEAKLQSRVTVPAGFVYDFESVPLVRATNKRGGTAHDYLCRIDSEPIVDKAMAAAVYFEIMEYCYSIDAGRNIWTKFTDWNRRWFKWAVVRVAPGYFHKFKVLATCQEIAGIEGDPYMTIEKLDAAIVESKETTEAIKAIPSGVDQKADMVEASEQVTADLKDAKEEVKDKL